MVYTFSESYSHRLFIKISYVNLFSIIHNSLPDVFFAWITYHLNFFNVCIIIYGRIILM